MSIGFMLSAGLLAGMLELGAHRLMRDRTYTTPIPRYAVGVFLALLPWTAAAATVFLESHTVLSAVLIVGIGVWYVFGMAGAFTWLAYERDRPTATEADAERLAAYLSREHRESGEGD